LDIEFDTYAVLGLAVVAKNTGRLEEALTSLERLIQQDPKNYRPYLELADCYIRKNQRDRAIEILSAFTAYGIRNARVTELLDNLLLP
jgi:DNA-binding SARP family transcriptional activator